MSTFIGQDVYTSGEFCIKSKKICVIIMFDVTTFINNLTFWTFVVYTKIAGDQDPYAPMSTQADLFTSLGRRGDKIWTIIANADHAVHLSDERHRFVENVSNFLKATTS
jgi:hypothetical protein